ncbi:MAG: hypothetical protein EA405_13630 [Rhodospirillales bacterium]|nr:MAG: hypothetical protein EA405_13630 [Rhodospirillales bacterium]
MLDLNRGVMTRFTSDGLQVSMYLDAPGEYLDENGDPVPMKLASQAGFDTKRDVREAARLEKLRLAKAKIDLEYVDNDDDFQVLEHIENGGKLKVRRMANGRHAIFNEAGERITKRDFNQAEAEDLIAKSQALVSSRKAPKNEAARSAAA